MKTPAKVCAYMSAALIMSAFFYYGGYATDHVVAYFGHAALQQSETWHDAIIDTAIVLMSWAFGDYLVKRKQNKLRTLTEKYPCIVSPQGETQPQAASGELQPIVPK